MNISAKYAEEIQLIQDWVFKYFYTYKRYPHPGFEKVISSIQYSLETEGKRFRPLLSLLVAKTLGKRYETVRPVALAVEFIHTYSLIHDDLPCMDDDDERRGKPSNHKQFGEDIALLAGDALLTESFFVLANEYKMQPAVAANCVALVAKASGVLGMIGGQSMDIVVPTNGQSEENIKWIHKLKTGCLIQVAVNAAAVACEASSQEQEQLSELGSLLGYAFQISDDIDDFDENNPESTSYCVTMGLEMANEELKSTTNKIYEICDDLDSEDLKWLAEFNLKRALK